VRNILLGHIQSLHAFYGEDAGIRIARKHLGWYAKDRPENTAFRTIVNRATCANEQIELTSTYFERLATSLPPARQAA
ncbi:MAG: tRNA-dihydrouridine synthase, partial [Wenzhouxiangella sp.]